VTPFCEAIDLSSSFALLWSVIIPLPNDFYHRHFWPFCAARFPIATFHHSTLRGFLHEVLSFTLSDELLVAGTSCAAPQHKAERCTINRQNTKLRNNCDFAFHDFPD